MASSSGPGRPPPRDDEPPEADKYILFSGLKIQGLPHKWPRRKYRLSISMSDATTVNTKGIRPTDGMIEWPDPPPINASVTTTDIRIELYKRHLIFVRRRNEYERVGTLQEELEAMLASNIPTDHSKEILLSGLGPSVPVRLAFTISIDNSRDHAAESIKRAEDAVNSMHPLRHGDNIKSRVEGLITTGTPFAPAAESCASLLGKLQCLESVASAIAEVHPFVKMAFNIVDGVYKLIVNQTECDQKMHFRRCRRRETSSRR